MFNGPPPLPLPSASDTINDCGLTDLDDSSRLTAVDGDDLFLERSKNFQLIRVDLPDFQEVIGELNTDSSIFSDEVVRNFPKEQQNSGEKKLVRTMNSSINNDIPVNCSKKQLKIVIASSSENDQQKETNKNYITEVSNLCDNKEISSMSDCYFTSEVRKISENSENSNKSEENKISNWRDKSDVEEQKRKELEAVQIVHTGNSVLQTYAIEQVERNSGEYVDGSDEFGDFETFGDFASCSHEVGLFAQRFFLMCQLLILFSIFSYSLKRLIF